MNHRWKTDVNKSVARPKRLTIGHVAIAVAIAAAAYTYKSYQSGPGETFVGPAAADGELDTSRLPRISGATDTYVSAVTTIFVSPESVPQTVEATARALAAVGWQRYDAPFSSKEDSPDLEIMTLKKGAQGLNAFITIAPAQGNKTSVSYSAIPLKTDLPFPKDATSIEFDPERPYLACITSETPEAAMAFFNTELAARGWSAWSVKDQAKKPDGAAQPTDNGMFSYFVRDGHGPVIVLAQRYKDGRTHAKIETVPESLLTPKKEEVAEPVTAAPEPNPAADKMNEAFDQLTAEILKHAQQATRDAIAGLNGKAPPQATAPSDPAAPLAALRDTSAPVPLPETADNIEIDSESGSVDFRSASSVRALASFYRAEMKAAGWSEEPTVIDRDNMVALRFANGEKDVSITVMQLGKTAKVSASGSGLVSATADAAPLDEPSTAFEPAASSTATQLAEKDLEVQDIAGLPVPTPNSLNGSEKSLFRVQVNARVPASIEAVLAFYRRELGKRSDWKEAAGAIIRPEHATVTYETGDGPAALTLDSKNGETTVTLLVRKQAEAAKAGMLPKPGNVKLLFGNVLDGEASITIDKKTVKIAPGLGAKKPDGPMLEISPGKHTFSFTLPGQKPQTEQVDVVAGDVWGLVVGPGGVLPLQMY
jgi:hypothetical protein